MCWGYIQHGHDKALNFRQLTFDRGWEAVKRGNSTAILTRVNTFRISTH